MTHFPKAITAAAGLVVAGFLAAEPAAAQPPIAYSFGTAAAAASSADAPVATSRAPGADALRWLGGLGSTQAEPGLAPGAGAVDRIRRK